MRGRRGRHVQILLLVALLVGGLALRLTAISEPSIEQRETQSALLARRMSLGNTEILSPWKQRVLDELSVVVKPIEPPVLDFLASVHYRMSGENFWFPRLLSSLAWVIGGVFLYLIGRRLTTSAGAIVALGLYLVWPFGVWLSRHFMPDATMVAALLAAILAVIRYWEQPTGSRLLTAGVVSSVAAIVKPGVAAFYVIALFIAMAVSRREVGVMLRKGRLALFIAMTAALPVLYYVYGTYLTDFIWSGADDGRVTPEAVATTSFWADLWEAISYLLRYPQTQGLLAVVPLIAGIAGFAVAGRGVPRAVLGGLSVGYLTFALTIANYTSSNPYYSLPLIPILSLSIGVLAGFALGRLEPYGKRAVLPLVVVVAVVIATAAYKSHAVLSGTDTRAAVADYVRIGELTNHTTRAIVVDQELSTPVMYWGWIVGRIWEFPDGPLPDHLAEGNWDYLIVVGRSFLQTSQGLRDFTRPLPIVAQNERYAIFDLSGRKLGEQASSRP
jgi:4-amino-4-deoxy-L-arabinose transferase-like glycosyltransferase